MNIGTIARRLARQSAGDGAHLKSTLLLISPCILLYEKRPRLELLHIDGAWFGA
ncbi:hypothetical protein GCM10027200_59370 [Lentzea nigeriaca]